MLFSFRVVAHAGAYRGDDHRQRDRAGVRRAEAAFRQRAGAADFWQQLGGILCALAGDALGFAPGLCEREPLVRCRAQRLAKRQQHVDQGFIAGFGFAKMHHSGVGLRDGQRHPRGVRLFLIADGDTQRIEDHAPDGARGAAGLVCPGVSGEL